MKNLKKIIALAMASSLAVCSLAACGDTSSSDSSSGGSTTTGGDNSASSGKVYFLNFKPEQGDAWTELAADYTAETGVEVKVITAASGEYESTLKAEMAKSEAPTLFQVNGPVGLASWKDYCYDLSESSIYTNLTDDSFTLAGDSGEVAAVAYVIESYGIIYNKTLLNQYFETDGAVVTSVEEINNFDTLKAVVEDIQTKKDELGIEGAFTSAGMDSSSDWRFKTHLANLAIYYEFKDKGIEVTDAIEGTYLDNFKNVWDLYINNATCEPSMLSAKSCDDANSEFALGEAVFYQNGSWAYGDIMGEGLTDDDIGVLPIYIGVDGEENQGLCVGSENYWCVNKNASEADIQATLDFLDWVITSDTGKDCLTNTMGFVTPFSTFGEDYQSTNPLVLAANEYIDQGYETVTWAFSAIPSETWKDNFGNALLEYAQGTGEWSAAEDAFINGWKTEYDAAHANDDTADAGDDAAADE